VSRIAPHYTGELRNGDRVLGVPSRAAGVTVGWTPNAWSLSAAVSRAFDWVEYDRLALADAYARFDRRTVPLYGADLRGYWRKYDGFAHIRASVSRMLNANTMLLLQGENLLGRQRGEPDNATILPGRIVSGGLRITLF
jgi:iron complex outermembrane receptor protein